MSVMILNRKRAWKPNVAIVTNATSTRGKPHAFILAKSLLCKVGQRIKLFSANRFVRYALAPPIMHVLMSGVFCNVC